MDKEQAEKALGIIRGVIENTREDLIAHNWGMIWILHAFTNAAGFVAIGLLVERKDLPIFWYLAPLGANVVVNLIIIAILQDRDRGVRSFIEWQVHGIWITFIVFTLAGAAILHISATKPTLFAPLISLTSGIGFAMMGVVFYRRFFVFAVLFLMVAVTSPAFVSCQWLVLAVIWWSAMFIPGVIMVRERRRRQRNERSARIL